MVAKGLDYLGGKGELRRDGHYIADHYYGR